MKKSFLSVKETANYISISLYTLYRWEKSGKLFPDFRTIGLHRRYKISSLEEKFDLNQKEIGNKK